MIKLKKIEHGRTAPFVFCDHCNQPILDAARGAILFHPLSNVGDIGDIKHAHKGNCMDTIEAQAGGRHTLRVSWLELSEHIGWLAHNSGITIEQLAEIDRRDSI